MTAHQIAIMTVTDIVVGVVGAVAVSPVYGALLGVYAVPLVGVYEWSVPWLTQHLTRWWCHRVLAPMPIRPCRCETRHAVTALGVLVALTFGVFAWAARGDVVSAAEATGVVLGVAGAVILMTCAVLSHRAVLRPTVDEDL